MFFPTLTKWFPGYTGYNDLMKSSLAVGAFVREAFLEHKATFVPGEPRDLMDSMCEEIAATTDPTSSFYKEEGGIIHSFHRIQNEPRPYLLYISPEASAIKSLEDLFLGGAETVSFVTRSHLFSRV